MNKKKILITGAGGFIGRNLKEYLSERYDITALTHSELDLIDTFAVEKFLNGKKFDVIIHCASSGGSRKNGYDNGLNDIVYNNVRMLLNIERCIGKETKLIYFGSGAEYDKSHDLKKVTEDDFDKFVPNDYYGYAKYVMSKYSQNRKNIICLRLFGVFGKYEDYSFKFISNSIVKNLFKLPIVINKNVVFDYLYIKDLNRIIEKLIEEDVSGCYNVTPSQSIDLNTIANIINNIGYYRSKVTIINSGLNNEYTGDNKKILELMPNFKFTTYKQSINELFIYYKQNINNIDYELIVKDEFLKFCK